MFALRGKTALIIGAGGGIGGAIAATFASAGASLCLADIEQTNLERAGRECSGLGAEVKVVVTDAANEQSLHNLCNACLDRFGAIDILVNSAGSVAEARVLDTTLDEWHSIQNKNLLTVFLACRSVLPTMLKQKSGRIINISSQVGQKGGAGFAHYAAAKAGVIGFTKSLAREVAPEGILVNCIAPGPIDTAFVQSLSPDTLAQKRRELPLGRAGLVQEVAPTALLLASNPGGNLFVGQTLGPNSGDVML